ncbi:hypothetical protein SEA_A3WALLY_329 [Microbacterium phage A3Wally]|nr:hypothetical protein SEA_A3WALLY_329 [Microbacterium phage A3Wally]
MNQDEVDARIAGGTMRLLNPKVGDVVAVLERRGVRPMMLPLLGDWERMLEEAVEDWVYALHSAGVGFDSFVVAKCEHYGYKVQATWSEKDGVQWRK